jgi:class 3 adenylate cyclase
MSISLGLRARTAADLANGDALQGTRQPSAREASGLEPDSGALRPVSLRFFDPVLERRYQVASGAESLTGFRITTAAAAVLWLLAAVIIPTGTTISIERAVSVCFVVAALNWAAFVLSEGFDTLDLQHAVLALLSSVNGLVILWLASSGGVLPGYGVSAIMLLFAFGFVSRTAFVFAAWRSAVLVVGFIVAARTYQGRGSLDVDAFILGAAVAGTLVALRLLEHSRRRVFSQDIVITRQADELRAERDRADGLLQNILPAPISARLLAGERTIADAYPAVTVLFADIVAFTPLAARLPAGDVVDLLGRLFARFDELVAERGLEKIKTIGDAYMVAGGIPEPVADHAARVVDLGLAMIEAAKHEGDRIAGLQLRIGVHSGPVIGGVIGNRKFAFDIWGETVNIASRLESQGVPGRIQVSDATWTAVEQQFEAEHVGLVQIRGYGPMDTYTIVGPRVGSTAA